MLLTCTWRPFFKNKTVVCVWSTVKTGLNEPNVCGHRRFAVVCVRTSSFIVRLQQPLLPVSKFTFSLYYSWPARFRRFQVYAIVVVLHADSVSFRRIFGGRGAEPSRRKSKPLPLKKISKIIMKYKILKKILFCFYPWITYNVLSPGKLS